MYPQVLHGHGVVGLKTHRLNCVKLELQPPWDEFKLIDESWSGMRCSIEETISGDEHADDAETSYCRNQLRAMVRFQLLLTMLGTSLSTAATWAHADGHLHRKEGRPARP